MHCGQMTLYITPVVRGDSSSPAPQSVPRPGGIKVVGEEMPGFWSAADERLVASGPRWPRMVSPCPLRQQCGTKGLGSLVFHRRLPRPADLPRAADEDVRQRSSA